MNNLNCPVCGSDDIKEVKLRREIHDSFAETKFLELEEYTCNVCGSSGDFFNKNEDALNLAIAEQRNDAVKNILDSFSKNKINLSGLERSLDLPQRTLAKWKNNVVSPSSAGLALLKFIKLFPWLIQVAEKKYNYSIAQKIFISNAINQLLDYVPLEEKNYQNIWSRINTSNYYFVNINNSSPIKNESSAHSTQPMWEIK